MNQRPVLTISRQYASGGRQIAQLAAERLGLPFYDKQFVTFCASRSQMADALFEAPEQSGLPQGARELIAGAPYEPPVSDKVYWAQQAALQALAAHGPCVILGRGAGAVLKNAVPCLNVFIHAPLCCRTRRAVEDYGDPALHIEAHVAHIDKKRMDYYKFYAGVNGGQLESYDLCLNSEALGLQGTAEVIIAAYQAAGRQTLL